MADKQNSGGFESKEAPDRPFSGVPGAVAKYVKENGSEGAARVGNFAKNPFGPDKETGEDD